MNAVNGAMKLDRAEGFLADLRACGIALRVDGGKLLVKFNGYAPTWLRPFAPSGMT